MSSSRADYPEITGDSMLVLSMESPGDDLTSRLMHRMAEKSLSGDSAAEAASRASGGLFPEHERFGSLSKAPLSGEWRQKGGFSRAHLSMVMELDRLGFDPALLDAPESEQQAVAQAELVLWLASHSRMALGSELSSAALLGPSAVGSLSAVLARACGESLPTPSGPLPIEEKLSLLGSGPRMPADWHSVWYPGWALSLARSMLCAQHPGPCSNAPGPASCRSRFWEGMFVPAVAVDFSHRVFDGSASARARAGVMLASGAMSAE